ncbi:MAG: elongation factor P [Pseudomonadota bacterium]
MKINALDIRPGNVLDHDGKLYLVTKIDIIQPGKGNAIIQVDMKDIRTGVKTNNRWRTQEPVERARLDEAEVQFLYAEDDQLHFMNSESYDQYTVDRTLAGEGAVFLQDGMTCTMTLHEGTPLTVTLPATVVLTVSEAEAVVKGQTAASSYKPGVLENGQRVMLPAHITAGTKVVISTADGSYVERAKS